MFAGKNIEKTKKQVALIYFKYNQHIPQQIQIPEE